jgi:hypothetical protein
MQFYGETIVLTQRNLLTKGVTLSEPVAVYDGNPVGAFLDSEANKLWFCSESGQ